MIDRLTVINLDRTPQRWARFLAENSTIPCDRFAAIDGTMLDRAICVAAGLIAAENRYVAGALGVATSHTTLWRRCADGAAPLHVAEDDLILRADFMAAADAALAKLAEWDIVLWTHNADWPAMIRPAPGIGDVVLQYAHEEASRDMAVFRAATTAALLAPLVSAAGIGCYSISPRGAARLLARCLPLGDRPAAYAAKHGQLWNNTGLDVEMSRHYAGLHAFLALTPLAVAPNDQAASTIRGHLAAMHDPAIANKAVV